MAQLISEFSRSFSSGMVQKAATMYRRDEAALIQNGRVQADGTVKPRGGTKKTTQVQFGPASGRIPGYFGREFIPASGPRQWVVIVDSEGWASLNQGADWFDVAGELVVSAGLHRNYWSSTTFRQSATNYLMLANGGDEVWEYDGTFTPTAGNVTVSGWAENTNYPAGIKFLATFNDRVYFAGHAGNSVGASKVGDRNTLAAPAGLEVQVQTHDGDHEITGLYQHQDLLLAFKRESTAYIDGYGNTDIIVATGSLGLSRSVGCVAHRSIQGVGEHGVMWLSERGVEHLVGRGGPIRLVSEPLRPFFEDDVNWSAIFSVPGMPTALYYPSRHQYWLWLPTGNSAQNNRAFVYDLRLGACALDNLPVESDQYTLNIDANGYLCLEKDTSGSKAVLEDGYLAVAEAGDDGVYVDLASANVISDPEDETYLALPSNNGAPATLFTADRVGRPASPIGIGYDGFVRYMDEGETDNVATGVNPVGFPGETAVDFRVRTRPLLFGMPFHRKRGRLVDVLATAPDAVPGTIVLLADGVETSIKELSIPASAGNATQPRRVKVRVNGRGRTLQVEFRTEETLNLDGIRLAAQVLREIA